METSKNSRKGFKLFDFSGLRISMASPETIASWSFGEVIKPETINYRTFKPEKDGLFDERIFGPTKDYECYCGKYKRIRYKGIICDRCGVEITTSAVRRERMGHIELASPIAHVWYFKGVSSPLRVLLDITTNNLERIVYYALYLVKNVDEKGREETITAIDTLKKEEMAVLDEERKNEEKELKDEEEKEKSDTRDKVKNKERADLTIAEIEFKFREKVASIARKYEEMKAERKVFYDRMAKIASSLSELSVLEEEDYMFLREKNLTEFLSVGMGSEVILEVLASLDLKKVYADVAKLLTKVKGERRLKLVKKLRLVESFIKSGQSPDWMVLVVLPVIPPDLRPVVQLSGGKFATSDLNDFYRRVINRNNRLKHLIELGAPEIILRNEKRMLQEAVDSLVDFQKSRGRTRARSSSLKALKSLSDILGGKQGRFRQNLLGKRVDYSGRSVIIVGSELRIDQVGLPKEMALELFKPFLLREVIIRGLAQNIKSAKNFLDTKDSVIYDILEEITKDHPIMLNRAPTLHKLSILGFYPVLTDDYAIKLHPTVTAGYNADFDGDQMAVFVPLSRRSIEEVKTRMLPQQNLLKPADGTPIVVPTKEMALGCYFLTTIDNKFEGKDEKEFRAFASESEALTAYKLKLIETREPIWVRIDGALVKTSAGQVLFNSVLTPELRYINVPVRAADLKTIVSRAISLYRDDLPSVGRLIDALKEIGFWGATISGGVSISVFDCEILPEKHTLINAAQSRVQEVEDNYLKGLLTEDEKRRISNNIWIETTEVLADKTWDSLDEENPVKIIIKSGGARASKEQLKQLSAMKGLVIDPLGKIIEVPTKSNYREGLSIFEYIINARGARKGLTDSALKTADAGYLTRRLVDVSHDVIVREEDCGAEIGHTIEKSGERADKFIDRIKGRYLAKDVKEKTKTLAKRGAFIDEKLIQVLVDADVKRAVVRSPFYCETKYGICQTCYGTDLSSQKLVEIGVPVGVVAAQSIGEPGTQLTMRVKHFGGIVIADVTQGLPRVEELFEVRTPKVVSPMSDISGKVTVLEDTEEDNFIVKVSSTDSKNAEQREFIIPTSRKLKVKDGQLIASGQRLCEGYLDIKDILEVKGLREAQMYLLDEIQKVYESQGIVIQDKHFEVIVRKMSEKVIIEQEGDAEFIVGEVVSKFRFEEENRQVLAQGGRPAIGRISIMGVTRAAMYTDSWLSAASFQGTTTALMKAAIKGQVDKLLGLKENVIIGRLIPVTGELLHKYYSDDPQEEEEEAKASSEISESIDGDLTVKEELVVAAEPEPASESEPEAEPEAEVKSGEEAVIEKK